MVFVILVGFGIALREHFKAQSLGTSEAVLLKIELLESVALSFSNMHASSFLRSKLLGTVFLDSEHRVGQHQHRKEKSKHLLHFRFNYSPELCKLRAFSS